MLSDDYYDLDVDDQNDSMHHRSQKIQRFDGESDYSSFRLSDGTERQSRERKPSSSEFQGVPDDKLKQAQFEIDRLEDHKEQLTQESESLKSKIKELEKQLSMEKEECE
ncbi:hypothetical protein Tco_0800860, partial [Tanacetum coccineum]